LVDIFEFVKDYNRLHEADVVDLNYKLNQIAYVLIKGRNYQACVKLINSEHNLHIMRKLYIFLSETKVRYKELKIKQLLNQIEFAPNFVPTLTSIRSSSNPEESLKLLFYLLKKGKL
jgi:hypothetical protein